MSVTVALQQLGETLTQYRFAYLLTVGDDARSHVVAVTTTMTDDTLLIAGPGRRTRANLAAHPSVTLVWAPADPRDYSLIVDGVGLLRGDELAVAPTRAVLHRAGTVSDHHNWWWLRVGLRRAAGRRRHRTQLSAGGSGKGRHARPCEKEAS